MFLLPPDSRLTVSSCLQSLCGIDIHLTLGKKKSESAFLKNNFFNHEVLAALGEIKTAFNNLFAVSFSM